MFCGEGLSWVIEAQCGTTYLPLGDCHTVEFQFLATELRICLAMAAGALNNMG